MTPIYSLLIGAALAQDPTYDGPKTAPEETPEAPVTKLSAELGSAFTSGNAFSLSAAGGINGSHTWGANQFGFQVAVNLNFVRADTDGDGTVADEQGAITPATERITGGLRYDRFFGERNALYLSLNEERDRLAGLLWRFNEQFGYRRILVKQDKTDLSIEVGAAYTQENLSTGEENGEPIHAAILDQHYLAARLNFTFEHRFSESVAIGDSVEYLQNLTGLTTIGVDARVNNNFYISAKLHDKFSIKLTHRLAFDNVPAGPEFAKVDQSTLINLVATIL